MQQYSYACGYLSTVQLRCKLYAREQYISLECEYLTLEHVIERLTSSALE